MAIVKTLIVKGVARFLTDAYMSTIRSGIWNGSTIQVGYGGTGVTSAKGNTETPVFLASNGITPCSYKIPHATKAFKINGVTFDVFTNSTGTAPTIFAPTSLAGTGGYILATNSAKTGLEWVAANNHTHSQYVLLDSGTNEQVIKSSISSLGDGVISLWRATEDGYPMIGFHSGATKTKWGMLGFKAANTPIFRNTSNTDYLLAHAGNISNKDATIGSSLTTIATIAGVDIKAKIDLSSIAKSGSVTKTLNVDSWTNVSGFTGTGTYAIQINCEDLYASGILSGCGGSDTVIDEVPLHVTNKGANTWRPYVRVNGSQIQMTTNEASPGTSREYTIKILKLI
jgi:hypothetical protein